MRSYTRSATVFLCASAALGLTLIALSLWLSRDLNPHWTIFLPLTALAAVAHLYPIRSASDNAFYVVADVFLLAGVILLSPAELALMCMLAILPYTVSMHKRGPRIWIRYAFNSSTTVISTLAAHALIRVLGGPDMRSFAGVGVIMLAATLFTLTQNVQVAVVLALNSKTPFFKVGTMSPKSLLGEGLQPFLGIALAGLWQSAPWLLGVLPVPLLITYKLVRQVHLVQSEDMDAKTGLYGYKYFQKVVTEELCRSLRVKRPLSVIFADMDYLRNVNNQWGHLAGDEVLKQIAAIIRSNLRHADLAARFGGEEFVVMLPGTDLDEAYYLADRIRAAVAEWPFAIGGGRTIQCTISLGVACAPQHGAELTELVEAADTALYRAKAQGRNQVCSAQSPAAAAAEQTMAQVAAAQQCEPPRRTPPPAQASPSERPALLATCFLTALTVAGLATVVLVALHVDTVAPLTLLVLTALSIPAEMLKTRVYEYGQQSITVTLSSAITLAAVSIGGITTAVASALIGAVTHVSLRRPRSLEKLLFNLSSPVVSAGIAALVYGWIAGPNRGLDLRNIAAGVVASAVFYEANVGFVACIFSLRSGRRAADILRENLWLAPPMIFLGLIGAFVGASWHAVGWFGAVLFAGPVLILRYSFSLYAQRTQSSIAALERAKAEVEQANAEKQQALDQLIVTMAAVIDARDNSTYGHSKQVARYAVGLARTLGLDKSAQDEIRTAALLHDLGKVGVPEAILNKPARLTDEEYTIIKEHAGLGERILSEVSALGGVARMVGEHHERFDGTGYPRGKAGSEITLGGRILAVADALDSILSDRPYSRGRSLEEALEELQRCSGHHFDPEVVAAVMRYVQEHGPSHFVNSARSVDPDHTLNSVAV